MPLLECSALTKSFGRKTALSDMTFTADAGQIIGLFGPNASGKSTLLAILAGIINVYTGEVRIGGQKPGQGTKDFVAYQSDKLALPGHYNLKNGIDLYDRFFVDFNRERALAFLHDFGLSEKDGLRQLSRGSQEKFYLSLTLGREAQVYLLDEPMNGIDPRSRQEILDLLIRVYTPEALTIIATHSITEVETLVDSALYLRQGQVALYGSAEDLRNDYGRSLKEIFMEVCQ